MILKINQPTYNIDEMYRTIKNDPSLPSKTILEKNQVLMTEFQDPIGDIYFLFENILNLGE